MILFRNVSLSRRKSTTVLGGHRFFPRKVTIFFGRETKTHILLEKINENQRTKIRQGHRRRERRLRSFLRHERMAVALALAECQHHSAQRPKMARAGREVRVELHGEVREAPLPLGGSQPPCLGEPWGVTGGDAAARLGAHGRYLPLRADSRCSCAQTGNQLPEVFRLLHTQMPVEQVIAVPKISLDSIPQRLVDLSLPQMMEHLVEEPTVLSPSLLQQRIAEQIVDIPVSAWSWYSSSRFSPGPEFLSVCWNVDILVPRGRSSSASWRVWQ